MKDFFTELFKFFFVCFFDVEFVLLYVKVVLCNCLRIFDLVGGFRGFLSLIVLLNRFF